MINSIIKPFVYFMLKQRQSEVSRKIESSRSEKYEKKKCVKIFHRCQFLCVKSSGV